MFDSNEQHKMSLYFNHQKMVHSVLMLFVLIAQSIDRKTCGYFLHHCLCHDIRRSFLELLKARRNMSLAVSFPSLFCITRVPMTRASSSHEAVVVVLNQRSSVYTNHNLEPPAVSKALGLLFSVSFQNVEAYPGHDAALRPNSLMYQFEHPAAKTDPLSWS